MKYCRAPKRSFLPSQVIATSQYGETLSWCTVMNGNVSEFNSINGEDSGSEMIWRALLAFDTYAPNLLIWAYDMCSFLDAIDVKGLCRRDGWRFDHLIDMDPPSICTLKRKRCTLTIWDVRNWINVPFEELFYIASASARWQQISHDCQAGLGDTYGSHLAVIATVVAGVHESKDVLCNKSVRPTAASQAWYLYGQKLGCVVDGLGLNGFEEWKPTWTGNDKLLPLVHKDEKILRDERQSFFGGVVSCFQPRRKHETVDIYDCNAMYLWLGCTRPFPAKYEMRLIGEQCRGTAIRNMKLGGFVACRIKSRSIPYPVKVRDAIKYTRGEFDTYLPIPEFCNAEENGDIASCYFGVVYKQEYLLKRFSEYMLYQRRKAAEKCDKLASAIAKRVGNGLWGKFGQRNENWKKQPDVEPPDDWAVWCMIDYDSREAIVYRSLNGDVWERSGTYDPAHASPIICATMTSYARIYMYQVMCQLPPHSILYSSVDSLHLTPEGSHYLNMAGYVNESEPGKFSHRETMNDVIYAKPGWYTSDKKVVHSGVPIVAEEGSDGDYHFIRNTSLRHFLSTPYLVRMGRSDVSFTPPTATRRVGRNPKTHSELFGTYIQKDVDLSIQE